MMPMITTPVLAFSVRHYCRNRCNCIIALSLPVNGTIITVLSGSPVVLAARLMAWVQLQEPLRWRAASWGTKCNPTDERHGECVHQGHSSDGKVPASSHCRGEAVSRVHRGVTGSTWRVSLSHLQVGVLLIGHPQTRVSDRETPPGQQERCSSRRYRWRVCDSEVTVVFLLLLC